MRKFLRLGYVETLSIKKVTRKGGFLLVGGVWGGGGGGGGVWGGWGIFGLWWQSLFTLREELSLG